ncbi:hypothetical protein D3C85_1458330 [compost metagenome]
MVMLGGGFPRPSITKRAAKSRGALCCLKPGQRLQCCEATVNLQFEFALLQERMRETCPMLDDRLFAVGLERVVNRPTSSVRMRRRSVAWLG